MSESETWKAQIKKLNSPTGRMKEEKLKTIEFIWGAVAQILRLPQNKPV